MYQPSSMATLTVTVCLPSAPGLDASTVALTLPADVLSPPARAAGSRSRAAAPASSASAAARVRFLRTMRTSSQKLFGLHAYRLGSPGAYFSEGLRGRLRLYWPAGRTPGGTPTMHRDIGCRLAVLAPLLSARVAPAPARPPPPTAA